MDTKKHIIILILAILGCLSMVSAAWVYTSTGDSYKSAGNWQAAPYNFAKTHDDNPSTYGAYYTPGGQGYANYTKITGSNTAIWDVIGYTSGATNETNITISDSCFNAYSDVLQLKYTSSSVGSKWYCWNGTAYELLESFTGIRIYEEEVWWNITEDAPETENISEWTREGRFLNHSYVYPHNFILDNLDKIWKYPTTDGITHPAAVSDGVVYFGDDNRWFYAVYTNNASLKWSYYAYQPITTTPAVWGNYIYFGVWGVSGRLYALYKDNGTVAWTYGATYINRASPLVVNGIVYYGDYSNSLYALDATTGHLIWSYATSDNLYVAPAYGNGTIYIPSADDSVYALNAYTGALKWSWTAPISEFATSMPPVVGQDLLYIPSEDDKIYVLNKNNGTSAFNITMSGSTNTYPGIALRNDILYTANSEGWVRAYNATNTSLIWQTKACYASDWSGLVITDNVVMTNCLFKTGVLPGAIAILYLNGTMATYYDAPSGNFYASPIVADDKIYVGLDAGSSNRGLYAIGGYLTGTPSNWVSFNVTAAGLPLNGTTCSNNFGSVTTDITGLANLSSPFLPSQIPYTCTKTGYTTVVNSTTLNTTVDVPMISGMLNITVTSQQNSTIWTSSHIVTTTLNSPSYCKLYINGTLYTNTTLTSTPTWTESLSEGNHSLYIWCNNTVVTNISDTYWLFVDSIQPYSIYTCSDLDNIPDSSTSNFVLMSDIDCSGHSYTPANHFKGTLDGQLYSIRNLAVSLSSLSGLFKSMETSAVVANLDMLNVSIAVSNGFAGAITASMVGNSVIYNVRVTGHVSGVSDSYIGGLVGYVGDTTIIAQSWNEASISGTMNNPGMDTIYLGGIAGYCAYAYSSADYIKDTFNNGSVTWIPDGNTEHIAYASGICNNGVSIINSFNTGTIHPGTTIGYLTRGSGISTIGSYNLSSVFNTGLIYGQESAYGIGLTDSPNNIWWYNASDDAISAGCNASVVSFASDFYFVNQSVYSTFNFDKVWSNINNGIGYPTLQRTLYDVNCGGESWNQTCTNGTYVCVDTNSCGTEIFKPLTCGLACSACTENWQVNCVGGTYQCTDLNSCGTTTNRPSYCGNPCGQQGGNPPTPPNPEANITEIEFDPDKVKILYGKNIFDPNQIFALDWHAYTNGTSGDDWISQLQNHEHYYTIKSTVPILFCYFKNYDCDVINQYRIRLHYPKIGNTIPNDPFLIPSEEGYICPTQEECFRYSATYWMINLNWRIESNTGIDAFPFISPNGYDLWSWVFILGYFGIKHLRKKRII